ncbi:thioredoxin family protein [Desulfitobacterium sp.]|uniref:thioredoxin family protein n=1 Tax=Desulfitobacterium sp. TaxID=49981 RepID=UPI002C4282D4|nr:thioredoxin family protein [Desulfitobacterium sp.]HVJ50299.1 thioredoxin family protein [Desulfitobacterium sp.]
MSKLLSEKDTADIRKLFTEQLVEPVILRLFVQDKTKPGECIYCNETEQLAQEIADLNDKIRFELHQYPTEDLYIKQYEVERVPALILETSSGQDTGVRFYGIPSGYEFGTLIEDIVDISAGKTKLPPDLISQVEHVQKDVTIKVFTTPT